MKNGKFTIEIDLNDVLYEIGEYGEGIPIETNLETMKRQLREGITTEIKDSYLKEFKDQLRNEISTEIKQKLVDEASKYIPELISDMINKEYEEVDKWGTSKGKTSFKNEFVKILQTQMVYKKESWDDRKNLFSKMIDDFTEAKVKEFKNDFDKKIKEDILNEAYAYALDKISRAWQVRINDLK